MASRTVEQLCETIVQNTKTLSQSLQERSIPSPTVDDINATDFKAIDETATKKVINAARELEALVGGPSIQLSLLSFAYHDISAVGTLLEFNIPSLVPLEGEISFADLAVKSGLLEDKLTRILRYATTNFIFRESSPNHVAHTTISAALARDPQFVQFLRLVLVDLAPIAVSLPKACLTWPQSEAPNECGVNAAFDTSDIFFKWLSRDAGRQERFDAGMAGFSAATGTTGDRPQTVDVKAYPWGEKLPKNARVVDIGGGSGHVSKALAAANPSFHITVQDRAEAVAIAERNVPNVSFQAHDFFSTQPLHGADAYFFRQIMHDWPRCEAVNIIRALIPALKPGARVLVSEYVVPSAEDLRPNLHTAMIDAKVVRQIDLQMMSVFNSKERTRDEFAALFTDAHENFKFCGTYQIAEDMKSCIFEAVWDPPVSNGTASDIKDDFAMHTSTERAAARQEVMVKN